MLEKEDIYLSYVSAAGQVCCMVATDYLGLARQGLLTGSQPFHDLCYCALRAWSHQSTAHACLNRREHLP